MTESEYIQQHETYLSSIVSRFIARYPEQRASPARFHPPADSSPTVQGHRCHSRKTARLLCRTIHGITNSPKEPDFCIRKSLLNNLRIFAK